MLTAPFTLVIPTSRAQAPEKTMPETELDAGGV